MKKLSAPLFVLSLIALTTIPLLSQPSPPTRPELDVLELKVVPDGHYLLDLQSSGQVRWLNIRVQNNSGTVVNSSDPGLKGMKGDFKLFGNGVFTVVFQNDKHTASQWWLFKKDGSAAVKEVPDRGETQRAVPVPTDSLERPAKP